MSFRLISILVTLDDTERRNSPNRSVISSNSTLDRFLGGLRKSGWIYTILSAAEM